MEKYENIYSSICRLCLGYSNSKKMISLIDRNDQNGLTAYAKAASTFARINFTKEDCFPSNMCNKCLYLLKHAIRFKLVTESSDDYLRKIKNSVDSEGENLKEKIIEFTMFKFYLPNECHEIKAKESPLSRKNSMDNVCDDNVLDTDTEQYVSLNEDKILDKIENFIGSNMLQSQTQISIQKFLKRKKKVTKDKNVREQYEKEMEERRVEKKNFVCNVCNKVLANQCTYDHHMQRHLGCRFICEHCGKGFPILNELQIHQVTKHGTGPYLQCSHCPFKAPRRFDLIEHERIHSGERPYTCDKCGLTFRRRGIWRKHLIYHSEKTIQCSQCPKKFFLRSEMLAHANNIHDRLYVYSCSKCSATYTKTATVRRHMTERHGIPREMQGKIIRVNKGESYQEH